MQKHCQQSASLVQQATAAQRTKEHRFVLLMMYWVTSTVLTQVR